MCQPPSDDQRRQGDWAELLQSILLHPICAALGYILPVNGGARNMARFVVCAMPGAVKSHINLDLVTFVRQQDDRSSIVGFGHDIAVGIQVAEAAQHVLSGGQVHDPA